MVAEVRAAHPPDGPAACDAIRSRIIEGVGFSDDGPLRILTDQEHLRLRSYARELLLRLMQDLSEELWSAQWLRDLEFILWSGVGREADVVDGSDDCGSSSWARLDGPPSIAYPEASGGPLIDHRDAVKLLQLAEDADCWWVFRISDARPQAIPLQEWREIAHRRRQDQEAARGVT